MALFGLESTDISFLGLLLAAFGALVAPLTIFLIRVGRDIAVIKTTLESHSINITTHSEDANLDKKILHDLSVRVGVIETRITDSVFKRMDDMERALQFLHQVMYGVKAHSIPPYMSGKDDDETEAEGIFKKTDVEQIVSGLPRCTICGSRFNSIDMLAKHILKEHGASKND